jgi:hypothetical protein
VSVKAFLRIYSRDLPSLKLNKNRKMSRLSALPTEIYRQVYTYVYQDTLKDLRKCLRALKKDIGYKDQYNNPKHCISKGCDETPDEWHIHWGANKTVYGSLNP